MFAGLREEFIWWKYYSCIEFYLYSAAQLSQHIPNAAKEAEEYTVAPLNRQHLPRRLVPFLRICVRVRRKYMRTDSYEYRMSTYAVLPDNKL